MRRTIADARRSFEREWLPRLSDHQAQQGRQALERAETEARKVAENRMTDLDAQVRALRDVALRELTDVRDAYEQLVVEGADGRMSAEVYTQRLDGLARQQFGADERLTKADALVDQIEAIEEDPLSWYDGLTRRTGTTQDFPW